MPIKVVEGRKFDFNEMTLEDSLEVMEKVPALVAVSQGSPLPQGTLIFVAERIFKHCLVDGVQMESMSAFFKGADKKLFVPALLAGAEINFPDFFTRLKEIASNSSGMMGMMMGTNTSSQATAQPQAQSSTSQSTSE